MAACIPPAEPVMPILHVHIRQLHGSSSQGKCTTVVMCWELGFMLLLLGTYVKHTEERLREGWRPPKETRLWGSA